MGKKFLASISLVALGFGAVQVTEILRTDSSTESAIAANPQPLQSNPNLVPNIVEQVGTAVVRRSNQKYSQATLWKLSEA